jgi:hypothetical protein
LTRSCGVNHAATSPSSPNKVDPSAALLAHFLTVMLARIFSPTRWLILLLVAACAEDEPDPSAPSPEPCVDCTGCQGWRSTSCEYATRCGTATPRCAAQFAAIQCRSESSAEACAYQLHAAYCDELPPACDAMQIADNSAAIEGCQQYRQATCASAVKCGYAKSLEECLAKPTLDCTKAVGLSASFQQCLSALANVDCLSWLPPESCVGTIITSGPQTSVQ